MWSDCDGGLRTRSEYVLVEPVGAGRQCPAARHDEEQCVDCVLAWGEWSECSGGARTRSQVVEVAAVGAGAEACGSLQIEEEGESRDLALETLDESSAEALVSIT